jgi:NADH-quinone oxidoreductase subunit L
MGGLRWLMPVTFLTYTIGMMNLSGVPFFFAGGWTKEEILHATARWHASHLPHYLMLAGVVLTALYMTRQMIYVFFGSKREASDHARESSRVMTIPLIVLAACSILSCVALTPAWPWLHSYLSGEPAHFHITRLIHPMLFVSLALVAAGIGLGWLMYCKIVAQEPALSASQTDRQPTVEIDPLEQTQPALFRFLKNKMWLDELYDWTVIAPAKAAAHLSDWMDRYIWDGLVRAFGGLGQVFGIFSANFDERGINAGVDEATGSTRGLGRVMSAWHSGQIQTYLGAIAIGMLALLILYAWLV